MEGSESFDETAWSASPYGQVYVALSGSLDPRATALARGIDSAFGRATDSLRVRGDCAALIRLERISLLIEALRHSIRAGDAEAGSNIRIALAEMNRQWLEAAPMLPFARSPHERAAALQ
jgi:hypothetical protein